MSITQLLISFCIIMMMLSFVSERLSNLLKLYYQNKTIFIPYPHKNSKGQFLWGLKANLKILANRQSSIQAEKQREYRVLVINILVGIAIAIFSNANFFQLVKSISSLKEKNNSLDIITGWKIELFTEDSKWWVFGGALYIILLIWSISLIFFNQLSETKNKISKQNVKIPFITIVTISVVTFLIYFAFSSNIKQISRVFQHTIGFIITGLFLSLGSKFWHDLLDLLFKYKNVQQRLNQKNTYTDYHKPEQISFLANTSEYEIVDKLMKKYEKEIKKIEGVVSLGKNTFLDKKSGLFRKIIEAEFSTPSAQEKLYSIINKGEITIDYNTFYLRDYMRVLFTTKLTAIETDIVDAVGSWNERIKEIEPICYAYNDEDKEKLGSFRLFKGTNDKIYAESNFHVFASTNDLEQIRKHGKSYKIKDEIITLFIGNKKYKATIKDYDFGGDSSDKKDYCIAVLKSDNTDIIKEYNQTIDYKWLLKNENDKMKMFGATTKETSFWKNKSLTYCIVQYSSFKQELWLYKIKARSKHIDFGDSGSTLFYYDDNDNLKRCIIVAKSDHYAYVFEINE